MKTLKSTTCSLLLMFPPVLSIILLPSIEVKASPWINYGANGEHYVGIVKIPYKKAYLTAEGPPGTDVDFVIFDYKNRKVYKPNTWFNKVEFGKGKEGTFGVHFWLKKCKEKNCKVEVHHSWDH